MWLFFGLPILALFLTGIVHASESLNKVRDNWNEYRCNPIYIPFAGVVRPDVGVELNFQYCLGQFSNEILKVPMDAINSLFSVMGSSLSEFSGPMSIFRVMFAKMRGFVLSFTASTMSKAASSTSIFIHYLIKIRDVFKRFVGQGYVSSYLTYLIFAFMEGFVVLFLSILRGFVMVMLAISIVLALFQPELLAITIVLASLLASAGAF
jgi:hypothetical protein